LLTLEQAGSLPERYYILDLSADLRQRQQQTMATSAPHLLNRVEWLDRLPEAFTGVVIANELLDAMPAHVVAWREDAIYERGVSVDGAGIITWSERPANGALLAAADEIDKQCSHRRVLRARSALRRDPGPLNGGIALPRAPCC
jgi:SAM-dependent MidA family methyltransferase